MYSIEGLGLRVQGGWFRVEPLLGQNMRVLLRHGKLPRVRILSLGCSLNVGLDPLIRRLLERTAAVCCSGSRLIPSTAGVSSIASHIPQYSCSTMYTSNFFGPICCPRLFLVRIPQVHWFPLGRSHQGQDEAQVRDSGAPEPIRKRVSNTSIGTMLGPTRRSHVYQLWIHGIRRGGEGARDLEFGIQLKLKWFCGLPKQLAHYPQEAFCSIYLVGIITSRDTYPQGCSSETGQKRSIHVVWSSSKVRPVGRQRASEDCISLSEVCLWVPTLPFQLPLRPRVGFLGLLSTPHRQGSSNAPSLATIVTSGAACIPFSPKGAKT